MGDSSGTHSEDDSSSVPPASAAPLQLRRSGQTRYTTKPLGSPPCSSAPTNTPWATPNRAQHQPGPSPEKNARPRVLMSLYCSFRFDYRKKKGREARVQIGRDTGGAGAPLGAASCALGAATAASHPTAAPGDTAGPGGAGPPRGARGAAGQERPARAKAQWRRGRGQSLLAAARSLVCKGEEGAQEGGEASH